MNYRDHKVILIAVPIINALNYYLTYNIRWGFHLFATFAIDSAEGYLVWYAARWVILKFDASMPWENNLLKRFLIQVPLICGGVLIIIAGMTEVVNLIATSKPVPTQFYTQDLFIFLIWAVFINFFYLALYYRQQYHQIEANQSNKTKPSVLTIKTGKTQKRIPLDDFSLFYMLNGLIYALTPDGRIPVAGYTFDQLEKLLDPDLFFRANRQCILRKSAVLQSKREENGKLAVTVSAEIPNPVMISRLRAAAFLKWLQ